MNYCRRVYESEIEDYLEEYHWKSEATAYWWFIDRQVALPHGRLDMLFFDNRLLVVELKARPLRARDVCQVLRYQSDIRKLIRNGRRQYLQLFELHAHKWYCGESRQKFMSAFDEMFLMGQDDADYPVTCAVLIGADAPEEVVAAMDAIGGRVYIWALEDDDTFSFELQKVDIDPLADSNREMTTSWLDKYRDTIMDSARIEADSIQDLLVLQLFGESVFNPTYGNRERDEQEADGS